MHARPPRSYLFAPGHRPDRFAKACAAGADAVLIDLEDAVPASEKVGARAALAAWLSPAQPVFVRINGVDTDWFRDDLALCSAAGIAGIVVPKAERADDILTVAAHSGATTAILPLIETARGFANALTLAQAPPVRRLLFGNMDFGVDLGISGDDEELLYFRSQLVLVSRLAGIAAPVDGVTTAIDDPAGLRADTLRARRLGFGGKLCIHPKQVGPVNECFRPSAADVLWAKRVLEAASAANYAAVALDGKMIDRPVILRARAIVNESENPPEGVSARAAGQLSEDA
ncbi:MAG: CoA ester lyase [Casimicrobiaceae bacterium]